MSHRSQLHEALGLRIANSLHLLPYHARTYSAHQAAYCCQLRLTTADKIWRQMHNSIAEAAGCISWCRRRSAQHCCIASVALCLQFVPAVIYAQADGLWPAWWYPTQVCCHPLLLCALRCFVLLCSCS